MVTKLMHTQVTGFLANHHSERKCECLVIFTPVQSTSVHVHLIFSSRMTYVAAMMPGFTNITKRLQKGFKKENNAISSLAFPVGNM